MGDGGYGNVSTGKYMAHLRTFDVGDRVRVTHGEYKDNEGRIVLRNGREYGVVFDWDTRMHAVTFINRHLEKI